MKIREARHDDAEGIAAVIHEMPVLRSVAHRRREETASIVASNLARIATAGDSTAYVAEDIDGAVVGYTAVHWVPFLFLAGGEAYVTELFVRPSASGNGVGSQLLEAVVTEARKRGCARVSLLNGRDGEAYRRDFYRKRGWVERDRIANFILPLATEPAPAPASPT